MSRTVRRKNYIKQMRGKEFSKAIGMYAVLERHFHYHSHNVWSVVVYGREPTVDEIYKQKRKWFGESRDANDRTPSRWYRKQFEKKLRTYNNALLRSALKEPDFESSRAFGSTPSSHKWDWD